jgi:hypothetical protein
MLCLVRMACVGVMVGAVLGSTSSAWAGTIIKLGLGGDSSQDIKFDGTTLTTESDSNPATLGDQDTNVDFSDFLSGETDILAPPASFTLSGLTPSGVANIIGGVLVIQDFSGGTFTLYDSANAVLLSANLGISTMAGPLGAPATGALFTTSFASLNPGGSLNSQIKPGTVTLSMSLSDISSGVGFAAPGGVLGAFNADATINIAADKIPEPATLLISLAGVVAGAVSLRSRWR